MLMNTIRGLWHARTEQQQQQKAERIYDIHIRTHNMRTFMHFKLGKRK